jgi:hypothetical protein
MCSMLIKKKILGVLAENVAGNTFPDLVASATIAERLNLSLTETRETMRSMSAQGVIESDEEVRHALITREGLHWFHGQASRV